MKAASTHRARRRRRDRGFSLLELSAATLVLAIGSVSVIQLYHVGAMHLRTLTEQAEAGAAVANELETLRALPFSALQNGDELAFRGDDPALMQLPGARGVVRIADAGGGLPGLKEVSVRLEWIGPGGRTSAASITTLIADKTGEGAR